MSDEEFDRIKKAIIESVKLGLIPIWGGTELLRKLRDTRYEGRTETHNGKSTNTRNTEN